MFYVQKLKNWAQRSSNYLQLANIVLLVYIAFKDNLKLSFIILAPLTLIAVLIGVCVVGYLDYRLGFLESDVTYHEQYNPYTKEILERLKKIEEKI